MHSGGDSVIGVFVSAAFVAFPPVTAVSVRVYGPVPEMLEIRMPFDTFRT